jgi:hypothetical protein
VLFLVTIVGIAIWIEFWKKKVKILSQKRRKRGTNTNIAESNKRKMESKDANEMRLARLKRFGQSDAKSDNNSDKLDYKMDSKDSDKMDYKMDSKDSKDGIQAYFIPIHVFTYSYSLIHTLKMV